MAPFEILLLLATVHFVELPIVPMLLAQIDPVSTIFLTVVHVIIAAFPIVVPLVMMVVGRHDDRSKGGST